MIDTRYLIDPSGIIPEWIADNRDLCDPREEHEHNSSDNRDSCLSDLSYHGETQSQYRLSLVESSLTDDHRCIGIRHRDGVRTWPLVE